MSDSQIEAQAGRPEDRRTLRLVVGGVARAVGFVVGGRYVLGRAADAAVHIDHATVSRRHAELVVEVDTIRLTDLGSANGSRAGSHDLVANTPHELPYGEIFSVGDTLGVVFEGTKDQTPSWSVGPDALSDAIERAASFIDTGGPFCVCTLSWNAAVQHLDLVAGLAPPRAHLAALAGSVICVLLPRLSRAAGLLWLDGVTAALVRAGADVAARLSSCPDDGSTLAQLCPQALTPASTAIGAHPDATTEPSMTDDAGSSPAMRKVHALVEQVAATPTSIIILGETGVGKEVMARRVHARSERAAGPFMAINCAALSETLLESELFGYEKGAFTGAHAPKQGLIEAASGGTLFLDELGEMPLPTQAKLLRVLEERTVLRVGSVKTRPVDIRVVAATNRDLLDEIAAKQFRPDLYYRLNGMILRLPPLRDRKDEIVGLAALFAKKASDALHRPVARMSTEVRAALESYPWPGNVRELRNAVERMVLLSRDGTLNVDHLPDELRAHIGSSTEPRPLPAPAPTATRLPSLSSEVGETRPREQTVSSPELALDDDVSRIERAKIVEALERCAGNQTRAAAILGITRRVLIGRMEKYGMPRPRK